MSIRVFSAASGQTVYAVYVTSVDGKVADASALVAYSSGNWSDYAYSSPEQAGSGRYIAPVPGFLPDGHYYGIAYLQLGGSPAIGDTPIDIQQFDILNGAVVGAGVAVDVSSIGGSSSAATSLKNNALTSVSGAAASGTLTTTQMTTNLVATVENIYAGRVIYFTSGANTGRAALVTAYAVTGGKLTFLAYNNQPISSAPIAGDTFIIL